MLERRLEPLLRNEAVSRIRFDLYFKANNILLYSKFQTKPWLSGGNFILKYVRCVLSNDATPVTSLFINPF